MSAVFKALELIPYHQGRARRIAAAVGRMLPYLTARKALNFLACEKEKRLRRSRPQSWPYIAIIDVTNTCNLRCPYCPTGDRRPSGRGRGMIDPALVQALLEEIGQYLISANLFNWGEPLLHPRVAELVELFHRRRILTTISTNLNLARSGLLEDLCPAGLDYLLVSFSGATQATYEQYHRNGRLDTVLANVQNLVEYRNRCGWPGPVVEMKYLLFRHNRHEIIAARDLARRSGADVFRVVKAGGPSESLVENRQDPREGLEAGLCHQLWQTVTVNADGGIPPCCFLYFKTDDFGELTEDSIGIIRQNHLFATARKLFNPKAATGLSPDLKHPCLKCHLVHGQTHLQDYLKTNPYAVKGHRTGGY